MNENIVDIECEHCGHLLIEGECWNKECAPKVHKTIFVPDMFNITPWCKKYKRQPSHFLDNNCMIPHKANVEVLLGRYGYTKIPKIMIVDFFLWLSVETKTIVVQGKLDELF